MQGLVGLVLGGIPLAAALTAVAGAGACSGSSSSSSSSSGGGSVCGDQLECRIARDCQGAGFACVVPDGGTGCCVKVACTADTDCASPKTCDLRRGLCVVDTCDPSFANSCPAGEKCINGTDPVTGEVSTDCVPVANIPQATKCELDVSRFSLRATQTRQLSPTFYNNAGALVPFAAGSYASSADGTATVSTTGLVTGAGEGTATITVTPLGTGATPCTATVEVYGALAASEARVVVFDNRTGAPLSGVTVQLDKTGDTSSTQTTDAKGSAKFTGVATAADIVAVTAFPADHTWVTYASPGKVDLAMYLDPLLPAGKIAGVSGTFDTSRAQPPTGDIKLGLAAFSIAGALSDLNLGGLIGKTVDTTITIEGFVDNQVVPLPSGVYLKLQNDDVKGRVDMYVDGPCGTGADACKRVLWGLGGQVSINKIGPIINEVAAAENVDAGAILSAVLPFFRKFYHYVEGGFSLTDINAPANEADPPGFAQNDVVVKPNYLLQETAIWQLPSLPTLPSDSTQHVSGALLLAGTLVPGQGFVPQGVSAGLDVCTDGTSSTCMVSEAADGLVSCTDDDTTSPDECEGMVAGDLSLDYAPQHDGLEGFRYGAVAVALDVNSLGAGGMFTSVLVGFFDSLSGTGKKSFPINSFLGFNKGTYTAATRTFAATTAVDGSEFYRLNLDTDSKPWLVYFAATGGTFSVKVPAVPTTITGDRTENLDIQAFKLLPGSVTGGLPALAEFNSTNFDKLVDYTGAFSTQECTPAYPAKDCLVDGDCNFGGFEDFTCDGTNKVCVSSAQGVTFKSGSCPAGAVEKTSTAGKAVCVIPPACELK
ncbi:MAG: Ig-like domain-containing protein [Deltaproteobacteria bacterium]|nr:Ig-like domain-containing protein [Deltaproteobacteria bacterium]